VEELGVDAKPSGPLGVPVLMPTADGYECTVDMAMPRGAPRRWSIRHDSLIKEVTQP
jgi:hypothetical protein